MEALKLEDYKDKEPEHGDEDGGDHVISEIKIKFAENGFIFTTVWADGDWRQYVCVTPEEVRQLLSEYL